MAQLNQAQRKRAFELIDEKVSHQKGLKEVESKKLFLLSIADRKLKFSTISLIERLADSSYYESTCIDLMDLLEANDVWQARKEAINEYNKEKTKETKVLVQQLKDEITFGTELSIIQDALSRLDEFMNK